jgi:prolyl oligopeptidase
MDTPQTKKEDIVDDIQGIKISDPYRWLENADDPEVKGWIENQNEYTDSVLKNDIFKTFSAELIKNFKAVVFSNPVPVHGHYFYTERQPDQDQAVLYMKKELNGVPVELVNPNGLKENNTVTLDYWNNSHSGKYIAYGLSEGGNEMATLYVIDTDTSNNLEDKIIHCRYASIRWLPDDSGFFYTRNPRPGTVPKNEEHLHSKCYFHKLGDNPDNDELIFGKGRPKDDMLGLVSSIDGRYLAISAKQTWTENDIYMYDTVTKETKPFIVGIKADFSPMFINNKVIVNTNYEANNGRFLYTTFDNLYKPIDEWKELISERNSAIQSTHLTKDKIIIEYLTNACSEVIIFDYSGKETGKIPLPQYSSLAGLSSRREEDEFFYGVTSFTFPKVLYYFDPKTREYSMYRKTDNPVKPDEYNVKQEWCISKDGTKVPMFIYYKKDIQLNGNNPTILYGYGGFGNNEVPSFSRGWVPWMERGCIFAIANIRGGGEFGDKWHKDGIMEHKQNCFDDFIAVVEYLIYKKYTNKNHLGILGGSNGGLLVSAVAVQRPDLFKAVCSRVPLTDMVRFPKFGMAIRWVHEYGNPEVKKDLENILKWSPYQNVKQGIEYPNILFTTAEKDSRVNPLHSRKMTALLQSVNKENKVLIFTEMDAGHGAGKPIAKIVEGQALMLSFFAQELDLKI